VDNTVDNCLTKPTRGEQGCRHGSLRSPRTAGRKRERAGRVIDGLMVVRSRAEAGEEERRGRVIDGLRQGRSGLTAGAMSLGSVDLHNAKSITVCGVPQPVTRAMQTTVSPDNFMCMQAVLARLAPAAPVLHGLRMEAGQVPPALGFAAVPCPGEAPLSGFPAVTHSAPPAGFRSPVVRSSTA
jgi:hypothetical protein